MGGREGGRGEGEGGWLKGVVKPVGGVMTPGKSSRLRG
jgi:hypothetical protein